jgi:endonuclease/exonuclease/phosphatase family metal-dependent hydrolase
MYAIFRLGGYFSGPLLSDDEIHAIAGEPARTDKGMRTGRLTVATWNIEHGSRYEAILSTLRKQGADIILLQEADRFCRRSGNRDVAHDLAQDLGMNWVSAGEFQEIGEASGGVAAITGQAILSSYPIENAARIVFSRQSGLRWRVNPVQPRRGGRIALHATIAGVDVYNVHLESSGSDAVREAQIKDVLGRDARTPGAAAVIAGDFNNTRSAMGPLVRTVGAHGFIDSLSAGHQQTSVQHQHPIDWLFARAVAASSGRVLRVDGVSDHFPLIATLTVSREER